MIALGPLLLIAAVALLAIYKWGWSQKALVRASAGTLLLYATSLFERYVRTLLEAQDAHEVLRQAVPPSLILLCFLGIYLVVTGATISRRARIRVAIGATLLLATALLEHYSRGVLQARVADEAVRRAATTSIVLFGGLLVYGVTSGAGPRSRGTLYRIAIWSVILILTHMRAAVLEAVVRADTLREALSILWLVTTITAFAADLFRTIDPLPRRLHLIVPILIGATAALVGARNADGFDTTCIVILTLLAALAVLRPPTPRTIRGTVIGLFTIGLASKLLTPVASTGPSIIFLCGILCVTYGLFFVEVPDATAT